MTAPETLKAARLLKTLAKPLWSAGQTVARNAGEFARDIRPGMMTPRLDRFATGMGARVADATAHTAGMGGLGRTATRVGQYATGLAPIMAVSTVAPTTMPIWSTLQNVGHAAGQAANWGLDQAGAEKQVRGGGQDAMVNLYSQMQNMPYTERQDLINRVGQGQGLGMENGAYAQTHGNPWGFQQGAGQLGPMGQGDMRGYLMQRALQVRAQQQAAQGYGKSGSSRVKAARALRSLLQTGWQTARGAGGGAARGATHIPASRMTVNVPSIVMRPRGLPHPGGMPSNPMGYGQIARKWLGRGAKAVAVAAPLPLAVGASDGWFGADQTARDVGSDIAMNEFQNRIQQQGWLGQHALGVDPSLMLTPELHQTMPGFQQAYENRTGQKLQYGPLASVRNAWNNPSFLASDSAGSYNVPAPLPFNPT